MGDADLNTDIYTGRNFEMKQKKKVGRLKPHYLGDDNASSDKI